MLKNIDKNLHFVIFMQKYFRMTGIFHRIAQRIAPKEMLFRGYSYDASRIGRYWLLPCAATAAMRSAIRSASPKK